VLCSTSRLPRRPDFHRRDRGAISELKSEYDRDRHPKHAAGGARFHYTAYMYLQLIEFGATDELFLKPGARETEDYITGRFG
jgi:phosphate transport system ATP-binding protein